MTQMWTVYYNLREFPQLYVVREIIVTTSGPRSSNSPMATSVSLERVREAIFSVCPFAYNVGRMKDDDPCIVETWL